LKKLVNTLCPFQWLNQGLLIVLSIIFIQRQQKKPRTVKSRRGLKFVITNSITANQKEKEIYSAIDIQLSTP